jgi:hypothetical protein
MSDKQKFHHGDLVRIAKEMPDGMEHFPGGGCLAVVLGSYHEEFGHEDDDDDIMEYSLCIEDVGEVSWYEEGQLTLMEHGWKDLIKEWK